MVSPKDPSPPFEIVNRPGASKRRGMELPKWMRREEEPTQAAGPVRETSGGSGGGGMVGEAKRWWTKPVAFRLPQGTLVMLGLGALVLIIVAYLIGDRMGRRSISAFARNYQEQLKPLESIREAPPTRMIPSTITGAATDSDGTPLPNLPGAGGVEDDPRQPGMNYFRLISLPANADEAQKAVAFLKANGVDAGAIPFNNGRSVKLLALRGFENPLSDPVARDFADRLKMLGRKWKSQEHGSSDWKDLYPEKYRPGRN
ncbi:MAG: hypothetical protein GC162_05450 [Planctomycetes bacterium]|nr:hypothetical protein [Planctomycetota bacterium]